MSVTTVAFFGVVVAAIVVLLLARPVKPVSTSVPHSRFGSELDPVAARPGGKVEAAEPGPGEHQRCVCLQTLSVERWQQYWAQWGNLQEQFIDCPGVVVAKADQLLNRLAIDRGFPDTSRDDQFDALSQHYPESVNGARQLRNAAKQSGTGTADAEVVRRAMIAGRALFENLLADQPRSQATPGAQASYRNPREGHKLPAQRTAGHAHL